MGKINDIAKKNKASKVIRVKVSIGPLAHCSADHFKEHFVEASLGGIAENAQIDVEMLSDIHDPHAQDILLKDIEVES